MKSDLGKGWQWLCGKKLKGIGAGRWNSQSSSVLVSSCWIKVMWTRKVLKNEPFVYGVGVFIRISLCVNIEDAEKRA